MASILLRKSTFNIQHQNKKNIHVGYLLDEYLSVAIVLECSQSKHNIILNQTQWNNIMNGNSFEAIYNALSTTNHHSKKVMLQDNLFYKINTKSDTIMVQLNNSHITYSRDNLQRIQLLYECINAHVIEKISKLETYQQYFSNACSEIKNNIINLPPECIRKDFVDGFVQNFNFSFNNSTEEYRSFVLELSQINHEVFASILISTI